MSRSRRRAGSHTGWPWPRGDHHPAPAQGVAIAGMVVLALLVVALGVLAMSVAGAAGADLCTGAWCTPGVVVADVVIAVATLWLGARWLRSAWNPDGSRGWFAASPWLVAVVTAVVGSVLAGIGFAFFLAAVPLPAGA